MATNEQFRRTSIAFSLCVAFLFVPLSFGQGSGDGQTAPAPSGDPAAGRRERNTSIPSTDRTRPEGQLRDIEQRPIFVSGTVRLGDGSKPMGSLVIELVCNGLVRLQTHTDTEGYFRFEVGRRNSTFFLDASIENRSFSENLDERALVGCEVRADLAGFQSDSIQLGFRPPLSDPDIGIIYLYPIAPVSGMEGYTFSVTTAEAPEDARQAYQRGLEYIEKQKWEDAERELIRAVSTYPRYAAGWYQLGHVQQAQNKVDDAIRSYRESIRADSKFVNSYGRLAGLAVLQQKWEDAVEFTSEFFRLNPFAGPNVYFFSAVANYNLGKIAVAESHAVEAANLDSEHRIPKINHLLGVILAQEQDYFRAAENLRLYLKFSPEAADRDTVKQLLATIENARANQTVP